MAVVSTTAASAKADMTDSLFIGNIATDGGGIYNESGSTATVTDSLFIGNIAIDGGGIYNLGTLINTRNLFINNTGGDIEP